MGKEKIEQVRRVREDESKLYESLGIKELQLETTMGHLCIDISL